MRSVRVTTENDEINSTPPRDPSMDHVMGACVGGDMVGTISLDLVTQKVPESMSQNLKQPQLQLK